MPRLGDMVEERATLVGEMRGVLDTAEGESRDLSAEERQEYDRRETRVQEIEGDIRRHEAARRAEELDVREVSVEQPEAPENRAGGRDSDEYREALDAYARGRATAEQRTTLNVGTDADGGYAVPESWTALYESLREFGQIRAAAEVIATEGGGNLNVPYVSDDATEPAIEGEEDPIASDAETFAEKVIGAYKIAQIRQSSSEFVQDALFDVASFVGRRLGEDLALASGAKYVNGTGTNQPEGLFTGAGDAGALAANGAITSDEIIDLYYSVISPYRGDAAFAMNDSTVAAVRKLTDTNGQYLWQPALSADAPDLILGKRVITDPNIAELGGATGAKVIGFGNIRRAFTIRDVLGVSVKFLDQTYAANDQVAWLGKLRTSSAVVDAGAFKTLDLPAA